MTNLQQAASAQASTFGTLMEDFAHDATNLTRDGLSFRSIAVPERPTRALGQATDALVHLHVAPGTLALNGGVLAGGLVGERLEGVVGEDLGE